MITERTATASFEVTTTVTVEIKVFDDKYCGLSCPWREDPNPDDKCCTLFYKRYDVYRVTTLDRDADGRALRCAACREAAGR